MVLAVGSFWEASAWPHSLKLMLCAAIAELAAGFQVSSALSRVLPNPLSPAGYFPSEAIYLFPFRRRASVSHLSFSSHVGKSPLFPTLPNRWRWAWARAPSMEHGDVLGSEHHDRDRLLDIC